ncbi:metallophosphoesterase family protein [Methylocella sp.]|uniref:metallophosphoesterase family protein n=1 Tax=Methylocella sp. TaxID=1978226 RepID=UPI0037845A5A
MRHDDENRRPGEDGVDRRGFLDCMRWAGAGLIWTAGGGLPRSVGLANAFAEPAAFSFAQISDSHIGFSKAANPDARATLAQAIDRIRALPQKPDFMLHTGDVTHLSRAQEFDDADAIIKAAGIPVFFVPGEHDFIDDEPGRLFLARYGEGSSGLGWRSFDARGLHFIGLVNVANLQGGGLGALGAEQLDWLRRDVAGLPSSTPIVVFAHIPLWTVYPDWGWGTADGAAALAALGRFGSVTVLNGHIHQVMQKVEGRVAFHTARSTAFPQPAPGSAPSPGPMLLPAGELRKSLGVATVTFSRADEPLAIVDAPLAG